VPGNCLYISGRNVSKTPCRPDITKGRGGDRRWGCEERGRQEVRRGETGGRGRRRLKVGKGETGAGERGG